MLLSVLAAVLVSCNLSALALGATSTSTYHLTYDVSSVKIEGQDSQDIASFGNTVANGLGMGFLNSLQEGEAPCDGCDIQARCLPLYFHSGDTVEEGQQKGTYYGVKCFANYATPKFSFDIIAIASGEINMKVDVTLTTSGSIMSARDALVKSVPKIDEILAGDITRSAPIWSIQQRLSPSQAQLQIDAEAESMTSGATSPLATIENMVLTPKILTKSDISNSRIPVMSSIDDETWAGKSRVDIWDHEQSSLSSTKEEPKVVARSIFIDSNLRATTGDVGKIHSEAFVHPALISHALPKRVAVLSDMPIAHIKEILKYKSITNITVVGTDDHALEAMKMHMPQLNDCTLIDNVQDSCVDDSRLEFVTDEVDTWIDNTIEQCYAEEICSKGQDLGITEYTECYFDDYYNSTLCAPYPAYDVILVDVSSEKLATKWLDTEFQRKLQGIIVHESIIVVNAGSAPSSNDSSDYKVRENYLSKAALGEEGGIYVNSNPIMVYDEPSASPFNSAFFLVSGYFTDSYYRFVRRTPTAMDLDIVDRFQPQPIPQLSHYDGPTHVQYLRPRRVWQDWFCNTSVGAENDVCQYSLDDLFDASKHGHQTVVNRHAVKGRSLHAAEDIPKGSFILSRDTFDNLHIDQMQWRELNSFVEQFPDAQMYHELRDFYLTYGFENEPIGLSGWSVSIANNNTFTNHACTDADANTVPSLPGSDDLKFSPVVARRPAISMLTRARRDIKKGEEIMIDYSSFRSDDEDGEFSDFLSSICNTGVGLVPVEEVVQENVDDLSSEL